jgi:hypothetical protein
MAVIPDFSETRVCPACGFDKVSMKYVEKRQILDLKLQKFRSLGLIDKTCQRCRFKWPELPIFLST